MRLCRKAYRPHTASDRGNKKEIKMRALKRVLRDGGCVLFAVALSGCGPGEGDSKSGHAVRVRTAPVVLEKTSPPVHTSGRLASVLEARFHSRLAAS